MTLSSILTTILVVSFAIGVLASVIYVIREKTDKDVGAFLGLLLLPLFCGLIISGIITCGWNQKLCDDTKRDVYKAYGAAINFDTKINDSHKRFSIDNYDKGNFMGPYIADKDGQFYNIYLRNDNGTIKMYTCQDNVNYTEVERSE